MTEFSAEKRALFATMLARAGLDVAPSEIVPQRSAGDTAPLSFAQQRLWFLDQLTPSDASYNVAAVVRLEGVLDVEALRRALSAVVERHEVLRTTFFEDGGKPLQRVHPPGPVSVPLEDLRSLAPAEQSQAVSRFAADEARRPFDLASGPPMRARLLCVHERAHVLLVTMHHIVSDGWSIGIMVRELSEFYRSFAGQLTPTLPELPIQYADFARWQRARMSGEVLENHLSYWKARLAGAPAVLELPVDRPRSATRTTRGALRPFALPEALSSALAALGRPHGATLYMTLLAAFHALLHRWTGQADILVGSPIANRTRPETENLIGFFVNTLALRTDLSEDPSFVELIAQVREVTLGGYAHQDLPFEKLVEELVPVRDLAVSPIFQVMFALQNAPEASIELPDLAVRIEDGDTATAIFDLSLSLRATPRGLVGSIEYSTDLFDDGTITRLLSMFRNLLESVVADAERPISQLELMTTAERRQILGWSAPEAGELPDTTLVHLFEEQVRRTPDALAVYLPATRAAQERRCTYRELERAANQLARMLRRLGVGPEVPVALCLERSPELVTAMLAVWKAGGAYVPLDTSHPRERLATILAETQAHVLVAEERLAAQLAVPKGTRVLLLDVERWQSSGESPEPHGEVARPDNLAFILFTSGSTGVPKGAMVPHRGLLNHALAVRQLYDIRPEDRVLQFRSAAFDVAAEELWPTLLAGAAVVLRPEDLPLDPPTFLRFVGNERITELNLPASFWHELVARDDAGAAWPACVRLTVAGSEPVRIDRFDAWRTAVGDRIRWLNAYGPTETTITATVMAPPSITAGRSAVPIGRPIRNVQAYVLDRRMQPVPIGVSGELYIGGAGLARGYLGRPDLTAEKFVPDPFSDQPGARLYRTGDLARWLPDGNLDFLGRIDRQVKVRGHRIEPGEIEAVLRRHPGVRDCAVAVADEMTPQIRLVAFIVTESEGHLTTAALHRFLAERLPRYMLPSDFVQVGALPLLPGGKIDRSALPLPQAGPRRTVDRLAAPRTPVEQVLNAIWEDVLDRGPVSIHDDFFALGGHSLLATQVVSRARDAFHVEIPLRALFENPTIAGLSACIASELRSDGDRATPPIARASRTEPPPLAYAQERMWAFERLLPGTPLLNMPFAVRLEGRLDHSALDRALREIVVRHEVLRTTFAQIDGAARQIIGPPPDSALDVIDLRQRREDEREQLVERLATREAVRPFDLTRGALLRATLLQLTDTTHVLLLTLHHIIADGWSIDLLVREAELLYEAFTGGFPATLTELPIQYADFAVWERECLNTGMLAPQLDYWKRQLRPPLAAQDLPGDRPRADTDRLETAFCPIALPPQNTDTIVRLGRADGASPFMVVLAGVMLTLFRAHGQPDVRVGTLVAHRNRFETEGLIGLFANTLLLRTDLSGDPSFRDLLRRVRDTALGAYAHQDLPFELLVQHVESERLCNAESLFRVLVVWQNVEAQPVRLPGLVSSALTDSRPHEVGPMLTTCDLTLVIGEGPDGVAGSIFYKTALFDAGTIDRFARDLEHVLACAVARPDVRLSEWPVNPRTPDGALNRGTA